MNHSYYSKAHWSCGTTLGRIELNRASELYLLVEMIQGYLDILGAIEWLEQRIRRPSTSEHKGAKIHRFVVAERSWVDRALWQVREQAGGNMHS